MVSFTACTTMQPIHDFTPSKIHDRVRVGDHVSIIWRSGAQYDVEVTGIDDDALHGRTAAGKHYKIAFEGIRSIEVAKTSGWQVATGVGAVVTVAVIAFIIALIRGLHDSGAGGESSSSSGGD
jgi:hypothetical protein